MSTASAPELAQLERVHQLINSFPHRTRTRDGGPGGLVEFPDSVVPLVVGDLHSSLTNLKLILEHEGNLKAMDRGERILVLIGDTVHNDVSGMMREMDSSVAILEYIVALIEQYPNSVVYIRGNHDTFDERLTKSGIFQGKEFKNTLIARKGEAYFQEVDRIFDDLPMFITGKGYAITHAGPVRGGASREQLIHIKEWPNMYHQLMWNRINEFRGNPSMKEYDGRDIQATLAKLNLPADTEFIVGHNPLWGTGAKSGVWMDVIGVGHHHIIYSGAGSKAPYFLFQEGKLVTKFAVSDVEQPQDKGDDPWKKR